MSNHVFVAKLGKEETWLTLEQHLNDTADVMESLCDGYVSPAMADAAGLSMDDFCRIAVFLAAVHDIGKATAAFQGKICHGKERYKQLVEDHGCHISEKDTPESPHALAGATILNQFLHLPTELCDVVAAHHGEPRRREKLSKYSYQWKRCSENYYLSKDQMEYQEAWRGIYEYALIRAKVSELELQDFKLNAKAQMILTGLIIMADWIASNETYFPLFPPYEVKISPDRTNDALKQVKIQSAWAAACEAVDDPLFQTRFGFEPNTMQQAVTRIASGMEHPGLMVIEAPMGMGKTEAALAAAETMSRRAGSGGVFFGLPTQGTANGMLGRFLDWAERVSEGKSASFTLAHGAAKEHPLFSDFAAGTRDDDKIQINAWMADRHRTLLPDFVIGTIDQALMAALRKRFLMLLHLGLCGKTVVIDEVHSYDAYMSVYLETLLAWLGAYHAPVILLSATLTTQKREEFFRAYTGQDVELKDQAYPLISWSDGDKVKTEAVPFPERDNKQIRIFHADADDLASLITDKLSTGGCAGVILDTVAGAQEMRERLKQELPKDYRVILLHSRFLPEDRSRLEQEVLRLVGKKSQQRDHVVIVGTQVLEQSLDLDFDILFTDPCPVDLLFQRMGRLHRHKRIRPEKVSVPSCYLLSDEISVTRASYPYDAYVLRRTEEALTGRTLRIPEDIRPKTEAVYDLELGSDGIDKETYRNELNGLKTIADQTCIPLPNASGAFSGMVSHSVTASGVRYGMDNMEILLLKQTARGIETVSGKTVIPAGTQPDKSQMQELLKQRISLRENKALIKQIDETMAQSHIPWLRHPAFSGRHIVLLDEDQTVTYGNNTYEYKQTIGWRKRI